MQKRTGKKELLHCTASTTSKTITSLFKQMRKHQCSTDRYCEMVTPLMTDTLTDACSHTDHMADISQSPAPM